MKKLTTGILAGGLLLWPMLAHAGEREEKYTLLLVGGVGGILVAAGLYAFLMILAAAFLRHKALLVAVFALCAVIFIFSQYTSIQTLRVAIGLWQNPAPNPGPAAFGGWLLLLSVLLVVFAVAIFRFSVRVWRKQSRQRSTLGRDRRRVF